MNLYNLENVNGNVIKNISNVTIRESKIHGLGLYTEYDIPPNTILCVLDGQVIEWDFYEKLYNQLSNSISNLEENVFMEWNALSENELLVRPLRTCYSFINHSRNPNLEVINNPLRIISKSMIKKGEELTLDYRNEPLRKEYLDGHGSTYL
jgi:hypothetical protein